MDENLLYPLQLLDVRLYEADIERIDAEPDQESDVGGPAEEQVPAPRLTVHVGIQRHDETRRASVFLTTEIEGPDPEAPDFRLSVTIEGLFDALVDLVEIDSSVWQEFEDTSSVSLLWPYVREVVHSFTRRMRVDVPVLPTLNQLTLQRVAAGEHEA